MVRGLRFGRKDKRVITHLLVQGSAAARPVDVPRDSTLIRRSPIRSSFVDILSSTNLVERHLRILDRVCTRACRTTIAEKTNDTATVCEKHERELKGPSNTSAAATLSRRDEFLGCLLAEPRSPGERRSGRKAPDATVVKDNREFDTGGHLRDLE